VPIYEYQCDDCGHSFDVMQKMSDDPLTECEKCGGPLRKVLHPVAIHFKGSGFYTTDYGKGSGRRPGARDTGSGDSASSSSESSSSESSSSASSSGESSSGDGSSAGSGGKAASGEGKSKEKQKAT
jgi:putative FmdB family regulatory protein